MRSLRRTTVLSRRRVGFACVIALATARLGGQALAARRLFEPTDLEIEDPGDTEFDCQVGLLRGADRTWRVSMPDFEFDLGLYSGLELDLDGALFVQGPDDTRLAFDHWDADNLWLSLKVGVVSWVEGERGISLGLQVGPKWPTARDSQGVGAEGLLLLGAHTATTQLVINIGGLWDPATGGHRPYGVEGGLDLKQLLVATGRLAFTAEASTVLFGSADPRQLSFTAGLAWLLTPRLEISLVGLVGAFDGSDRYGLLLGVSPKIRLFGSKS